MPEKKYLHETISSCLDDAVTQQGWKQGTVQVKDYYNAN